LSAGRKSPDESLETAISAPASRLNVPPLSAALVSQQ
jgi:hypothetical protein